MQFDDAFYQGGRERLYSSVISDVLDSMGLPEHALDPALRPLSNGSVLFGRARTASYVEVFHRVEGGDPYAVEIALVDDLSANDVAVFNCAGTTRYAAWGELLSTAARARGAVGAVIDGQTRDAGQIQEMGFPVFCRSIGMLDAAGRAEMHAFDVPIQCGGVAVNPGDLIFGDIDGVLAIPVDAAQEAVRLALQKVAGEDTVRAELARGDKLRDVFDRHGIL